MFLKHLQTRDLVEALDLKQVIDPFVDDLKVRTQAGEDTMDVVRLNKADLVFASGEPLPRCWCDSHYREHAG